LSWRLRKEGTRARKARGLSFVFFQVSKSRPATRHWRFAILFVLKNSLCIAADVNDAKDMYLFRLNAIENQIAVHGKAADIGAQLRREAFADAWKFGE
jgi:hypothetical protein